MEFSNLILNAKDIDDKKGIVSFYFADFNSVDEAGRMMDKNAFNRTFNNNFKRFAHLLNHDRNTLLGKPLEVGTDTKGAFMVSQLSKSSAGADALILYGEGIYNEHSFGFNIVNSQKHVINNKEIELVKELKMWEASTVTWGMNEYTPTISLNQAETLLNSSKLSDEILKKLDKVIALLPVENQHQNPPQELNTPGILDFIKNY